MLLEMIPEQSGGTCRIVHSREMVREGERWLSGDGFVAAVRDSGEAGAGWEVRISGTGLPAEWYLALPRALVARGAARIELESWGWWLGEGPKPGEVAVLDHIACRLPSVLTGSVAARSGAAFLDMRGAYSAGPGGSESGVVVWHTEETEGLSEEEMEAARLAGCAVASPSGVPWAIGARAAGCGFRAVLRCLYETWE